MNTNDLYKNKKALLKVVNPMACTHTIFDKLEVHQARIENDPDIQRQRAESERKFRRERMLTVIVILPIILGLWSTIGWYLQGVVSPVSAALCAVTTIAGVILLLL